MNSAVDRILDSVLSIYNPENYSEPQIVYIPVPYLNPVAVPSTPKGDNPDKHILITKEEYDTSTAIKQQAQAITEIKEHLKALATVDINVKYLKNLWNERYFEKAPEPPKNAKKVKPKAKRVQNLVDALMAPKKR